jgi:hypothetical protein
MYAAHPILPGHNVIVWFSLVSVVQKLFFKELHVAFQAAKSSRTRPHKLLSSMAYAYCLEIFSEASKFPFFTVGFPTIL